MTVRPGCLEGFKKQAAECIRITREKDTHILRYDWFTPDPPEVIEFKRGRSLFDAGKYERALALFRSIRNNFV